VHRQPGQLLQRLEDLAVIADLDGDIDMDVEGDRAVVSVVARRSTSSSARTVRSLRRCRS
jgi:hypothetical protein